MRDQAQDPLRLRTCVNDLVSLLGMPAVWNGRPPAEVVEVLLESLLRLLFLDFAYARVAGSPAIEAVKVTGRWEPPLTPSEMGRALAPYLARQTMSLASRVSNLAGKENVSLAYAWLGSEDETGVVVAGSLRPDFPTVTENLLLRVAINLALTELQADQVRSERQRAEGLERVRRQLHTENAYLRQELDDEQHWGEIIGGNAALKRVLQLVTQVAPTNACVLLQGETGTGKELVARAVHRVSDRRDQVFVKLNCAAMPTGLLESELFGHEKGAFTGAVSQRIGRFELADHGTLFLDEVGEIPLELQAKLLRVLQEQEFERLGGTKTIRVNVRLVAASNRDLAQMVEDHAFRSDLYYRLKVFPILIPPLRDRVEDIPALVRCFTERYAKRFGKPVTTIAPEVMAALCRYPWPGNVREIENFVERCVILSPGSELEVPLAELKPVPRRADGTVTLEGVERDHIVRALTACNWVIAGTKGAAAKLGMKRSSLQHKMQKLGIVRPI